MHKKIEKILSSPYKAVLILVLITAIMHYIGFYIQNIVQRDTIFYIEIAKEILNPEMARQFSHFAHEPLLPMVFIAGYYCGMDFELTGMLFIIITSSFIPLAIFMIAKEIFKDNIPALLAAMLASIHPFFIMIGSHILRDPPYWTYLSFAIAFLLIAVRKREQYKYLIYWAVAGLFTALAIATRKEGVELFMFVALWFPFALFLHRDKLKDELLRVFLSATVFLGTTSLICYSIYYYYTIHLDGTWNILSFSMFSFIFKRIVLIFN